MSYSMSFRSAAWTVLIPLSFVVTSLDPVSGSGATWQITPPPTLTKFLGEDLSLAYEYTPPHHSDPRCRFSLGYYAGGSTEDVLVRGYFDPTTGGIDVEEQPHPDRFSVTSYPGGFTFHVGNLGLSDSGQYLVDIRFSVYYYLHRAVVLTVYNRPQFLTIPSASNIIMDQGSKVTMSWTLSDLPSQPPIDSLQIKHTVQDVDYTLVDQRSLPDGSWSIRYPEEQLRFKDRISYAPGPSLESIDLVIRQLQPGDSGRYSVEIVYESGVIKLQDTVNLRVSMIPFVTDIAWISVPADPTYIVESSERTLTFTAHSSNKTDLIPKYELSKMKSGDDRELLASMVINEDNTPKTIESIWNPDWTFSYSSSSSSVLVTICNIQMQDAGRYTFDLRNGSGEILAHYQFTIFVLNDSSLNPEINATISDDDTVSLIIRGDSSICTPLISLYDESGTTHAFARASELVTRIPQTQKQVLVVLEYECHEFHHKIQRPLNLSAFVRLDNDQVMSTAGPGIIHSSPTTPAMTGTPHIIHNVQFKVIVSLGIILGVLMFSLLVSFYLRDRLNAWCAGENNNTDPAETYTLRDIRKTSSCSYVSVEMFALPALPLDEKQLSTESTSFLSKEQLSGREKKKLPTSTI